MATDAKVLKNLYGPDEMSTRRVQCFLCKKTAEIEAPWRHWPLDDAYLWAHGWHRTCDERGRRMLLCGSCHAHYWLYKLRPDLSGPLRDVPQQKPVEARGDE